MLRRETETPMTHRWTLPALALLAACGDVTSAEGELGRLRYSLVTAYVVEEGSLDEVRVVTGHPQRYHVDLTDKGEKKASDDAWRISHDLDPSGGVTVEVDESDEGDDWAPDFTATVTEPGEYEIQSTLDGEEFDYLGVTYAEPKRMQIIKWLRAPGAEDFDKIESNRTITVSEGAQATFLPIPKDGDGTRLVGDIETELTFSPETAAVRGENVRGVWEQDVWSSPNPVNIYFIEPGEMTVTITDPVHGLSETVAFEVTPIDG